MPIVVLPENLVVPHQKRSRHHPGVAYRHTANDSLRGRTDATCHNLRTEQFFDPASLQPKCSVESSFRIGGSTCLRPQSFEEICPVFYTTLVEEQDVWIGCISLSNLAQILYGFSAERSTKVAKKYKQSFTITQLIAQRSRI